MATVPTASLSQKGLRLWPVPPPACLLLSIMQSDSRFAKVLSYILVEGALTVVSNAWCDLDPAHSCPQQP